MAARQWVTTKGVNKWVTSLNTANKYHDEKMREALKDSAQTLEKSLSKYVYPAKQINLQDSRSPRSLPAKKSITVRTAETRAEVELRSYWARARSQAVFDNMKKAGYEDKAERRALWVNPNGAKNDPGGTRWQTTFREAPRLEEWTKQKTKADPDTWQFHRHTVWIPSKVLGPLAMFPARKAAYRDISQLMDKAHEAYLRRANND